MLRRRITTASDKPDDGRTEEIALKKLDSARQIRDFHHAAIWEAQKHFTWFISIILSAEVLILSSNRFTSEDRRVALILASGVGCFLSIVGFLVQRREGVLFAKASVVFVDAHNKAFPDDPIRIRPGEPRTGWYVKPGSRGAIENWPRKPNRFPPALVLSPFNGGIRDLFQLLFLVFAGIFIGLLVFAAFWLPAQQPSSTTQQSVNDSVTP